MKTKPFIYGLLVLVSTFFLPVKPEAAYFVGTPTISSFRESLYTVSNMVVYYDTISRESTIVCDNGTCSWQYKYILDSCAHVMSYANNYVGKVTITYSFFDSLDRQFMFFPSILVEDYPYEDLVSVDSIWGDVKASPGYNKSLTAKIHVVMKRNWVSTGSLAITGKLAQDTNVSFSSGLISISPTCSCQTSCGCMDSTFPRGKWNPLNTVMNYCYASGHCGSDSTCNSVPPLLFSHDSIYYYRGDTAKFMDTVNNLSLCKRSFYAALCPQEPANSYTYSWLGDKVLCLSYDFLVGQGLSGWGGTYYQYFLSSKYSADSLPTRNPLRLMNLLNADFRAWQSAKSIYVLINLSTFSPISLAVYSLSGRLIQCVPERNMQSGRYRYTLDMHELRSGCYLLVLRKGQEITSAKIDYIR